MQSNRRIVISALSAVLLVGLLLNATLGWWWADPLAAMADKLAAGIWAGLERHAVVREGPIFDRFGPVFAYELDALTANALEQRHAASLCVEELDAPTLPIQAYLANGIELGGAAEVVIRTLLAAGLKHAVVFANGLDHQPTFVDREGHRFLGINVLAGQRGADANIDAPMFRRGGDDRIDIGSIENATVVLEDLRSGGDRE